MGRLSEYDETEQEYLRGRTPRVESALVESAPSRELRWEDLDPRWQWWHSALTRVLSGVKEE